MSSPSHDSIRNGSPVLSSAEIDNLLSMTLIANLATLDDDGGIHILPMWLLRIGNDICIPTSRHTHKYRNLLPRPHASVMIDISRAGLNLKGVLIRGQVILIKGDEARQINHSIHMKYVPPEGLNDASVASYLSKGDDVTVKIHMDRLISWNHARESWKGFADSLKSEEDRKLFLKMLNDCQKYALAINVKEALFPTEPLIMALLLTQHKMISWLSEQVSLQKIKPVNPKVEPQEGFNNSTFVMK